MTEILSFLASPRAFAIALLFLLVAPGLLVRCLVRIYPHDDPRRRELLAELTAVPVSERPSWVLEQVETVLVDGLPSRVRRLRQRQRRSLRARLLASRDAPVMTSGATALAVFVLFELLMAMTWGTGLAIIFVPFVLLFPALPLFLLALLAIHRRQRMRRQGLR